MDTHYNIGAESGLMMLAHRAVERDKMLLVINQVLAGYHHVIAPGTGGMYIVGDKRSGEYTKFVSLDRAVEHALTLLGAD